jgi:hypothetical protein
VNVFDGPKRSIHINVSDETHANLKAVCASMRITMHDFLDSCINGLLDDDQFFVRLAERIAEQKGMKLIKRISVTDADSVYRAIDGEK